MAEDENELLTLLFKNLQKGINETKRKKPKLVESYAIGGLIGIIHVITKRTDLDIDVYSI